MPIFAPFGFMRQPPASPIALDPDAAAFLAATGITDPTIKSAINTLVLDLKAYSLWTEMAAIYPFVGGTSTTHKYNLKDPRDLDAAYRLSIPAGYGNTSVGLVPDDTNLASTFFIPSTYWGNNSSAACGFYSPDAAASDEEIVMGCDASGVGFNLLSRRYNSTNNYYGRCFQQNIVTPSALATQTGLTTISRISTTSLVLYFDDVAQFTRTTTETSTTRPNIAFTLGGLNGSFQRTAQRFSFAFISNGLSSTEMTDLYTSVQSFQTTLGRQV